jgi:hypothetical protein
MGFLIAGLIIGGVAAVGGTILGNAAQREAEATAAQQKLDEVAQEKANAEANRQSSLGTLSSELAYSKSSDLQTAADTETNAKNSFTSAMESTYSSQKQAEEQYNNLLVSNDETAGTSKAKQAASGVQNDTTIETVLNAQLNRRASTARDTIDTARDASVASSTSNLTAAQKQAQELRDKYSEGSTYMNLYNSKVNEVNTSATGTIASLDLETSQLSSTLKDAQTYDPLWDFGADLFGSASGIGHMLTGLGQAGVGTKKTT